MTKKRPNELQAAVRIADFRSLNEMFDNERDLMNSYQDFTAAMRTAHNTRSFPQLMYVVTKLAGESGEILDEFGKAIRDDELGLDGKNFLTEDRVKLILAESGDLLYYMSELFRFMGWTFAYVAEKNIEKLEKRYGIPEYIND